jgi:hypothetical protein
MTHRAGEPAPAGDTKYDFPGLFHQLDGNPRGMSVLNSAFVLFRCPIRSAP